VSVDLTSPWIPLSFIALLGIFMVRQFIQERRESRELILAEQNAATFTAIGVTADADENVSPPPVLAQPEPVFTPISAATVASVEEDPAPKKARLLWRTAWIWLPFLVGFFGQTYLTFIKPMLDAQGS